MSKNILFLAAGPDDQAKLNLGREHDAVKNELQAVPEHSRRIVLEAFFDLRAHRIQDKLLDCRPFIVHFSGHGEGAEGLVFADEDNNSQIVSGDALAALFSHFSQSVECVVLNVCYSEQQAQSISHHIPYVIGMADQVDDRAATAFSRAFYNAVSHGESVPKAFELVLSSWRNFCSAGTMRCRWNTSANSAGPACSGRTAISTTANNSAA